MFTVLINGIRILENAGAGTWRYSVKKLFLKISQKLHETPVSVSFLIQLQAEVAG